MGECSITETDIIVPSGADVVWSSNRHIRSNVIVESGAKLTIRCDLGMPENARITVAPGGQLVVDGARIYPNCGGTFWEGIIVQGQPGFPQTYDYFSQQYYIGQCTIRPGSVIEQAIVGARAQEPYTTTARNGGVIRATEATFLNCKRHAVEFQEFQNTTLNGQPTGNLSYFIRCNFDMDAAYLGDFANFLSMAHLERVDGIAFRGCGFNNNYPHVQSFADDRKIGIQAVNAGFRVEGTCDDDPPSPGNCANWAFSRFNGFAYGIHSGLYQGPNSLTVTRSVFTNNLVGIYGSSGTAADINRCVFDVGSTLPPNTQYVADNSHRGVHLYNSTGFRVEGNTLRMADPVPVGIKDPVGILIQGSGEEANRVYDNDLSFLHIGNLSNGKNRDFADPALGLQYLCNTNASNGFDFAVPKQVSPTGIAKSQGSATEAAANSFSGVISGSSHPEMHFLNKGTDLDYFTPPVPTNYTTSTITLAIAPFNQCASSLPNGGEEGLSDSEEQQLAQDFANTTDNTEKQRIANLLVRHYVSDSEDRDLPTARTWLANKNTLYSHFTIVETYLQEGDATGAQQAMNNIPVQFALSGESQVEYNHFSTLKGLQISALQNGTSDAQMLANNLATVTQVAGAGEYYASAQAKNLINAVNGPTYPPTMTLPDLGDGQQGLVAPPSGNINVSMNRVSAVPNPAKDLTVFHYSIEESAAAPRLLVKSMDGRTVWHTDLSGGKGQVTWDFGDVADGIYFFSLELEGKIISTDKLVIVR